MVIVGSCGDGVLAKLGWSLGFVSISQSKFTKRDRSWRDATVSHSDGDGGGGFVRGADEVGGQGWV
jgi:hypothetical protein